MNTLFTKTLPFWEDLSSKDKLMISENAVTQHYKQGSLLYFGGGECKGLEIIWSGQVRVFINSPKGGEITLYRLLPCDICILSAACMIKNLDFDIHMEMEKDSDIVIIPRSIFKKLSGENIAVKDFTLELLSSRFSDVMWLVNQLVFSNMGQRLAQALLEQCQLSGSDTIAITHEILAKDLGTAREVVTRLLKQFQLDGYVKLSRGSIQILNAEHLKIL